MKIHTDYLTRGDIREALLRAGLHDVHADISGCGSRSRFYGFNVRLEAAPKKGRRRRNSGHYGAEDAGQPMMVAAATWDEHGAWMAQLYERDPFAIVGPYKGRADFHAKTNWAYHVSVEA